MIAAAVASTILMTFIGEDAAAPCMLFSLIGIGVLVLLFSQIGAGRISNKLVTSQLVVAPSGLALYQGDLCGKLRWEELKRVRLGSAASGRYSSDGSHRGLVLEVEGAAISIANVYDRPLELIYRLVMIYWKGGLACGHCKHAMTPAEGPLCVHCETSVTAAPDMLTSVDA
jgi:hypothetical protein